MRLSTKLSGIVAIGGVAALGAGLISSGGIGAAFTDAKTVTATMDAGTFSCALSSSAQGVTISLDGKSATVDFGEIDRSSGEKVVPLTVTNTGSIAVRAVQYSLVVSGSGSPNSTTSYKYAQDNPGTIDDDIFYTYNWAPGDDLASSESVTNNIGFRWQNWDVDRLDHVSNSGITATWTINCDEVPATPPPAQLLQFDTSAGGDGSIDSSSGFATLSAPVRMQISSTPTTLPPSEPSFTYTGGATNSEPMLYIEAGGHTYYGWSKDDWGDDSNNVLSWSDVTSAIGSSTISDAGVLSATDAVITCFNYNGTAYIGSGACW